MDFKAKLDIFAGLTNDYAEQLNNDRCKACWEMSQWSDAPVNEHISQYQTPGLDNTIASCLNVSETHTGSLQCIQPQALRYSFKEF